MKKPITTNKQLKKSVRKEIFKYLTNKAGDKFNHSRLVNQIANVLEEDYTSEVLNNGKYLVYIRKYINKFLELSLIEKTGCKSSETYKVSAGIKKYKSYKTITKKLDNHE
jgi:hypothetical protein